MITRAFFVALVASACSCATATDVAPVATTNASANATASATTNAAANAAATTTNAEAADDPGATGVVRVGGAVLSVYVERDGAGGVSDDELLGWVKRSAEIVSAWCGAFPVPDLRINVFVEQGDDVGYGEHVGGELLRVFVGRDTRHADLVDDWVMPHEMLHTAMPHVADEHRWLMEGLSTFAEPIARIEANNEDASRAFLYWTHAMRQGRPLDDEAGLDSAGTWASTYWGGALFWLDVEVELRKATHDEKGVRDCVKAFLAHGGNSRQEWEPSRIAAVCDEATATHVFSDAYARMALRRGDVDTDALFRDLGVVRDSSKRAHFDDAARLAHVRIAMTSR